MVDKCVRTVARSVDAQWEIFDVSKVCVDTKNWATDKGLTCQDYVDKDYCSEIDKKVTDGNLVFTGENFAFPEDNCCACGKTAR